MSAEAICIAITYAFVMLCGYAIGLTCGSSLEAKRWINLIDRDRQRRMEDDA